MIVVTGRVQIPAERRERFVEVATEMCRNSRAEEDCIGYRIYGDLEQPDRYIFVEEWADEQALQRHFAQPYTGSFLQELGALLGEPADALFHTTAATRRLDPGRGLIPVE